MYFHGLGTATPTQRHTQAGCLVGSAQSAWFKRLDTRAHWIARSVACSVARSVLQRDNGMPTRQLALDDLAEDLQTDADILARRFEHEAPALRDSAALLLARGKLSGAFVYFVRQAALADEAPAGGWWRWSFGAAYSSHGALLKLQP